MIKELLLAFIGTFFGAWAAFQFQIAERTKARKKEEAAAARRALLVLCNQYMNIKRYYDQVLSEHENDIFRWLKLQPYDAFHTFLRLDVNSLTFLMDSREPKLIQELLLAEEAFLELVTTAHQRNDLHLNHLQVALQSFEVLPADEGKIKEILGQRLVVMLKDLTNSTYEMASSTLRLNEGIFNRLNAYFNANYSDYTSLKREDTVRNY